MQKLVSTLKSHFPKLVFVTDSQFSWSAETNEIHYNPSVHSKTADWSLLHETGHALLSHSSYDNDFELVAIEVAAWEHACQLARDLKIEAIDEDHIQDCLDTYRDWLHRRCICPTCGTKSLQESSRQYHCFNCDTRWDVTPSRFCRTYRSTSALQKQMP